MGKMFHTILSQTFLCLLKGFFFWFFFPQKRSECSCFNVANKPTWWLFSVIVFTHLIRIIILAFHLHPLITTQMTHSGDKHQLPKISQPQSFGSYVFCACLFSSLRLLLLFNFFFIMAMFLLIFGLGEENIWTIFIFKFFFLEPQLIIV